MSVYNGERFLAEAIESILDQSFSDFEFLILNDGSHDSSRSIIDGFAIRDARIKAIHRQNRGLIASLNEMIAMARAPLIARMDADDRSMPERFARQYAFMRDNPGHGVIGCWSEDIDQSGARVWLDGLDQPTRHADFLIAMDAGRSVFCHPSVMMQRDLVLGVGGYHAAFHHCEDYDLWLRLAGLTKFANLTERLLQYRQSSQQITKQHSEELTYGSLVARIAYQRRRQGLPDPTESLSQLPPVEQLDTLFAQDGLSRQTMEQLYAAVAYDEQAMRGETFDRLVKHVRGGGRTNHWRTVARLALRMGEPWRAIRLATALVVPSRDSLSSK